MKRFTPYGLSAFAGPAAFLVAIAIVEALFQWNVLP